MTSGQTKAKSLLATRTSISFQVRCVVFSESHEISCVRSVMLKPVVQTCWDLVDPWPSGPATMIRTVKGTTHLMNKTSRMILFIIWTCRYASTVLHHMT